MRRTTADRIPVTLLAGFLGSGKTTLVNRILSEQHEQRIAVIVNEFGDVNIDGRLVVGVKDDVIELSNGCICCTVRGDLAATLHTLLKRRRRLWARAARFDRVLIEASGLASPGPAVQTLLIDVELAAQLQLGGVVTLAHAGHIVQQLHEHPEASDQIAYADAIILNHCDQAAAAALDVAEDAIQSCNPHAEVTRATHACVEIGALLASRPWDPGAWAPDSEPRLPDAKPATAPQHGMQHGGQPHTCGLGTITLRAAHPLDLRKVQLWLQFLTRRRTHEVMRIKGLLHCLQHQGTLVVQGVYQWLDVQPGALEVPDESVLVLIGRNLDRAEIDRGWSACQADR